MKYKKVMFTMVSAAMGLILSTGFLSSPVSAGVSVDKAITEYRSASGVSGNLSSVGSDTLANLMTLWAESFKRFYPSVNIQIQAAGSSTAPPALTQATSTLGPMSRKMKDKEVSAFEDRYGYKPMAIPVAIDALAVYVNKDNPLKGLSIADIDAIFSSTRRCGAKKDITKWGELGLTDPWKGRDIQIFGRNSVSGTYGYFKKKSLCKGDYKNTVNEQPGSASVVQAVSSSINSIGYSGIGYKTSGVRALSLSKKPAGKLIDATPGNAVSGKYPLSRFLYVYVNKHPNKPLALLEKEFIKMVLSQQGQQVVIKDGYIPLPAGVVKKYLSRL
ncbi:Phosphate ABC transporter, periplasmic phosphate-binding protein PstS (TC 3.A.1.7.1) [hydrothermal vent metagenome]|uniref:Phosphate ABC transporter, periplasmic phosphate-binding protein PstS (TC 3.A.1.7.1) n=1 Tax=hydrothermal vent metagenome TaxID=652676 RepID=A0A3B0Y9M3_9ZZZZ